MWRRNRMSKVLCSVGLAVVMTLSMAGCMAEGSDGSKKDQSAAKSDDSGGEVPDKSKGDTAETASTAQTGSGTLEDLKQAKEGKLKIAYLVDGLFNDSSQRHWQQVQNECEMRGWELVSDTNVSGNYEADPTRKAFQNMMSQDPDAIVISYLDIPPIADLCVEANKRGIGVYCIGTDISDGIMMNVCSNNSVIGSKVMAYVMDRLGGEANSIGFQTLWMTRGIRRDEAAMALANSKTYNVKEVVEHAVTQEGFTDEMFSVTQNWLTKYGNDLDFVWACWDGGGITVAQAMAAAGYTEKDMFTVGMDGGKQAWAYIRSGEIPFVASLAEPFEYQVHQCFEGIKQLQVEGKHRGDADCIVPLSGDYSTDNMTVMVDKNNVPAVGTNIHEIFDYYGGDPADQDAWYNKGNVYKVADYEETEVAE